LPTLQRRPALGPATAFLAGVALAPLVPPAAWVTSGALALCLVLSAMLLLQGRGARTIALLLALLLGGAALSGRHQDHGRNASELLFGEAEVVELHFVGTLVGRIAREWDGQHRLTLHGRAERAGPRSAAWTVRLRIAAPPAGARSLLAGLDPGDRVRTWCRLRRPSGGRAWAAPGIHAFGRVKSERLVALIERSGEGHPVSGLRRVALERLGAVFPDGGAPRALAGAMLLGERSSLGPDLRMRLRDAGLLHLVAISGLHVGILIGLWLLVMRRAGAPTWLRLVITLGLLCAFVPLVGSRPSVLRASLAAGLLLLGRASGREGDGVNGLALLAALLVAGDPTWLGHPAFQLTFLATLGILVTSRRLAALLPLPRPLAPALALSAAAYLATAPAVVTHFGRLAPVGLLSNLVATPLCALLLGSGYGAMALFDVPLLGHALAGTSRLAAGGILEVASWAGAWEGGALVVVPPAPWSLGLYYLLLGPPGSRWTRRWRVGRRGAVALLAVWLHVGPPPGGGSGHTDVALLDVGQGLALAIRGPRGGRLLVDAGGSFDARFDPGERIVVPQLLRQGGRYLDVLVLTHGHLDHVGGAFAVLRDLEVGQLWVAPGAHLDGRLSALQRIAVERGTAWVAVRAGERRRVAGLPVRVLWPPGRGAGNEASVALLVGHPPGRLLVPGDLERQGEQALVRSAESLFAEALVVAHHGSRHGTSAAFLARVHPRLALISVGRRNPFGHPHRELLSRLRGDGIPVMRTDERGTLRLRAEGTGWRLLSESRAEGR